MSIKSFLGLQSQTEKIKEYRELLSASDKVDRSINQLAENYNIQKAQYDDLNSSSDKELREKGCTCFNEFIKQQAKDIATIHKKKTSIEKSIKNLEKDEEIFDSLKEIKQLFDFRQMWKRGLIKKSIYTNLLKAKSGGIVRYADVLLIDTKGRLLILQRAGEEGSATSKWCIPGGHVDPGETFKEAAIRELYEETGFNIEYEQEILNEVAVFKNDEIEIHYFMAHLTPTSHTTVVVDAFEEVGSEWIEPCCIDDYDFIFDMKDNLKKILGLEMPKNKFTMILKAFNDKQISENVFKSFCDKNPDEIRKAKNKTYFSHKERKDLAKKGEAMSNGKYPIRNSQDLHDAIRLVGASDMPESEVRAWIRKRAKALGLEDQLPESWKDVEKAEGVEDTQILSRESLDQETKNVVKVEDGPGDNKIEKSIIFKRKVYEEAAMKEIEETPSQFRYGQFFINFSSNKGDNGEKLGDFLATLAKVSNLGKSYSIVLDTEDNGKQEWKWKGGDFRLEGITKTENLSKSETDDFNKSQEGFGLNIQFNDLEEAQLFKSLVEEWNNEGKINIQEIREIDENPFEKSLSEEKKTFNTYLNFIEGIKTRLKNVHWSEEDNAKHINLDDLSEEVAEFEDKIAEAGQASFGRYKDGEIKGDNIKEDDPLKICQMIFDRTAEFRKELEGKDLYNGEISWIDDFLAKLKQSKYRLEMH